MEYRYRLKRGISVDSGESILRPLTSLRIFQGKNFKLHVMTNEFRISTKFCEKEINI
jgi:hypothetical protein